MCRCPICENECEEGEYVDVGVGCVKISPDTCWTCGWAERREYSGECTYHQKRKLWELQITDVTWYEYCFPTFIHNGQYILPLDPLDR